MSGYSSQREVREVTQATLRMEGRDPADYSVAGIMRDAFTSRGAGYGYSARSEADWRAAVERHRKPQPAAQVTQYADQRGHDVAAMTAAEREAFDARNAELAATARANLDRTAAAGFLRTAGGQFDASRPQPVQLSGCTCGGIGGTGSHYPGCAWH